MADETAGQTERDIDEFRWQILVLETAVRNLMISTCLKDELLGPRFLADVEDSAKGMEDEVRKFTEPAVVEDLNNTAGFIRHLGQMLLR